MNYVDLTVKDFTHKLGSGDPTPGGGGAAALSGALGIALTKMVAEFTVGKKKYAEFEEEVQALNKRYEELMNEFLAGIDADKDGFTQMADVFAMPNKTDEEKAARREALQKSLVEAMKPPFSVLELSVDALKVTEKAIGKTNTNVASDIGCAAVCLKSALEGGWINVLVNVTSLKNKELADDYFQRGQALLKEGREIADRVHNTILEQIS